MGIVEYGIPANLLVINMAREDHQKAMASAYKMIFYDWL
jgi:hypothetical protein